MAVASAKTYAFIVLVVLFTLGTRIAKVSSQAVRIFGCDSLLGNTINTLNVTMIEPSAGSCSGQSLTLAQFKFKRSNGQEDVICTQNLSSGCDTTPTPEGCVCKSFANNEYIFEVKFTFNPLVHEGGSLDFEPNCFPPGAYGNRDTCDNLKAVDPCENTKCQRDGICEIDGATPQCNCEGTYHTNDACEVDPCQNKTNCCVTTYPHEAYIMDDSIDIVIIILGVLLFVAVLIIVLLISFIIWLRWKKKFQSVISIIVHVETKEKKILQSLATKKYLHRFIYKDFTLYCCCCCWFSWCCWRGWCCLGGIIKGEKSDNQTSVGCDEIVAGCDDCGLCCMWCLSTADKVNVDVFCDKDKRALVLVTLESTLSWYFDAEDMPAKVKNYIENILQDPDNAAIVAGDESATGTITAAPDTQGALLTASRSNTSTTKCQPSEHLGLRVGYTAGNSDVSIEPEIDYPVGSGR